MKYIDVQWVHSLENEPIRLVSELDGDNFETRKLEFFRNSTIGYATEEIEYLGTVLSDSIIRGRVKLAREVIGVRGSNWGQSKINSLLSVFKIVYLSLNSN